MKNMTEEEYQRKLSEIKNENIQKEYKKRLKEERKHKSIIWYNQQHYLSGLIIDRSYENFSSPSED